MNGIKIAVLVTLIVPLAPRGASLLGNAVAVAVAVAPSPEQQQQQQINPPGSNNGASSAPGGQGAGQQLSWPRKDQSRRTAFTRRRFGTGGFFNDEKRFSPTGSNPLHNL
uniref:Uncharacterized protein n=1 Tax=Oryza brachyantha TaxID=4533 RepID=J3M4D5_ORYBR